MVEGVAHAEDATLGQGQLAVNGVTGIVVVVVILVQAVGEDGQGLRQIDGVGDDSGISRARNRLCTRVRDNVKGRDRSGKCNAAALYLHGIAGQYRNFVEILVVQMQAEGTILARTCVVDNRRGYPRVSVTVSRALASMTAPLTRESSSS